MSPPRLAAAGLAAGLLLVTGAAALAATDPYRSSQWGLDRIAAPAAWGVNRGAGQIIAVVDSGVDLEHPDLGDRFLRDPAGNIVGRDYIDDDSVPQDRNGHGTMVAGIAAATADNGVGVAGVAPEALLMPVRVLDAEGRGSAAHVDAAIRWAVDNGATVVNLSLESVAPLPGTIVSQAPEAAVQYAWDRGVVVVAAAGNSGSGFTDYDDASPVLLVGATDRDDEAAGFSDSGRRDAVVAPGVGIVSTWCDPTPGGCEPEHRYGQADGTSFAAPSVAGAVAILRAAGLTAEEAVARLRETAVDRGPAGPDMQYGHGRIDVAAAVSGRPPATASPRPGTTAAGSGPPGEEPATTAPAPPTAAPTGSGEAPAPPATQPPAGSAGDTPASEPALSPTLGEDVTPLETPGGTDVRADAAAGASDAGGDLLRVAAAVLVLGTAVTWDRVRRHLTADARP